MWWVLFLVSTQAFEPCGAQSPVCARDLSQVLAEGLLLQSELEEPEVVGLPTGELSSEDLWRTIEGLLTVGGSMRDLYALLSDGEERWISGEVIRDLFSQIEGGVDFLPIEDLVSVYSDGETLVFQFDFGGDSSKKVKTPATRPLVLFEEEETGSLEVGIHSRAEHVETRERTFRISNEVMMYLSEDGVVGIRQGDIKIQALFWFNVDFHTEHLEGEMALWDGRIVLQENDAGEPVVIDGFYQPLRFDDWAVIEAGGRVVPIGLPPLSTN